jgi:hypothetical protein
MAQVKAIAEISWPVIATEVRNSFARSTRRGLNIRATVKARKTAADKNISNILGGILRSTIFCSKTKSFHPKNYPMNSDGFPVVSYF